MRECATEQKLETRKANARAAKGGVVRLERERERDDYFFFCIFSFSFLFPVNIK